MVIAHDFAETYGGAERILAAAAEVFPDAPVWTIAGRASVDDFGLIPVERMACGRPVIAFAAGGALETVVAGETGEFFDEPTAEALLEVLERFDPDSYDAEAITAHAQRWDVPRFQAAIERAVTAAAA